ncbi:MAG TPA: ABC transporter permease [Thermomicrobiales bacterium]|nr:ABC transporter permease [Thermomicrobiales bacterium]
MTAQARNYILRRVIMLIPLTLGLSIVIFALIHLSPGDPALAFVSEQNADPRVVEQIREDLGLNDSLPVQYWRWLSKVATLDFGVAYTFNRTPVIDLVGQRAWGTIQLQIMSLVLSLVIAIPIGIISAKRQYSAIDNAATVGSFLGLAIPNFWFALMLQLLLAVQLGWLPSSTAGQDVRWPDRGLYYIMPVLVLSLSLVATFVRFMRSSFLEVIRQDYITMARAKGLDERTITYRHALKNAIIPMITIIGLQLPRLLSGSVIVETIFAWPGLGELGYRSILSRDYPVILALTLLTGVFILVVNIIVDVIYVLIDPRIAFE